MEEFDGITGSIKKRTQFKFLIYEIYARKSQVND